MFIRGENDVLINLNHVKVIEIDDGWEKGGGIFLKAVFTDGDWRRIATAEGTTTKSFEPIIKRILDHNSSRKHVVIDAGKIIAITK